MFPDFLFIKSDNIATKIFPVDKDDDEDDYKQQRHISNQIMMCFCNFIQRHLSLIKIAI